MEMMMMSCVSFPSSSSSSIPITRPSSVNNLAFSSSFRSIASVAPPITTTPRRRNKGTALTCNALFGLGVPELVVIAGVAAIVFGPKKLPEVGRSIGKTLKSFQQAAKEFETELKKEPDSIGGQSEEPLAVSEQEKQETEVSSSKESV
ncbi:sec-independent protein translocase protein TATA, chloroplastic-like [Lotus japonicus]|uniref:Sec-independent protein translocase protein TATA, chloroplastic n=1 Tax=Lotus japonicus TaxID=34305 RepID=I3T5R6_LOTJA|nr:sec-independent protein translocase protein TATA, chloroplastic-like [Lotus japonicus]AFK47858.1 unknown [Lotus japonicus]